MSVTFQKRQKEQNRKQKQQEKAAKKAERKKAKETGFNADGTKYDPSPMIDAEGQPLKQP